VIPAPSTLPNIERAAFNDIIPFLSEHIQLSDMLLFVGASSDLSLQLSKNEYGTKITGFIHVVDSNKENIEALETIAKADSTLAKNIAEGRLKFSVADLTNMPSVCKQRYHSAMYSIQPFAVFYVPCDARRVYMTVY
jgi:hypothetical protein